MDHDPDLLEHDDDAQYAHGPGLRQAVLAPEVLALAGMVLAAVSLLGLGLMNGTAYLPTLFSSGAPSEAVIVAAPVLGAALALLPVALGAVALRRLPDDGRWAAVAGASVLLGGLAFVLRLAVAAMTALSDRVQFTQF